MPKKAISSLELAALVNELQFLVQGKISQIYHQEKKEMLLQLHARGRGKELLKIISGKWLCLTGMKLVPLRPSGFCMQLRKYINNAVIKDIYQKDAERIVVFELEKEKRYSLISCISSFIFPISLFNFLTNVCVGIIIKYHIKKMVSILVFSRIKEKGG